MLIRPAGEDDAPAIAEVQVVAWRHAYAGMMPQAFLDAMDPARRALGWRRALSAPGNAMIDVVVSPSGQVIGFCVYGPSGDGDALPATGELVAINLLPAAWRRGLGERMMRRFLAAAAERRWHALTLWVLAANERARAFYEAQGFRADGTTRVDSQLTGQALHLLRYRRPADPPGATDEASAACPPQAGLRPTR